MPHLTSFSSNGWTSPRSLLRSKNCFKTTWKMGPWIYWRQIFLSSIRYLIFFHMSRLVNKLSPCVLAVQLFDIIVRQWTWENRNLMWFDGIYTGEKIPHIFALNFLLFILLVTTESDCHLYNFLSPLCSVLLISPFYLSFINQAEIPEISDCPDLRQNSLWWTWKIDQLS